jgi:hypothetical protein
MPINEGPEALIHNGTLNIIYSASGYWTNQYSLGRLTYNGTGSLLSASSWTKASQPVFQATSEVTGTGHASFTKSPDGSQDWIVYHAHANPTIFNEDRVIRIQPFTFNSDGTPNFGQPVPPDELLDAPSVGPDPERAAVAGDYQADGLTNNSDYNVWRATFGVSVFPGVAADGNGNGAADAADYVFWRKSATAVAQPAVGALAVQDDRTSLSVVTEKAVEAATDVVESMPVVAKIGWKFAPVSVQHRRFSGGARPAGEAPPLNSATRLLLISTQADRSTGLLDRNSGSQFVIEKDLRTSKDEAAPSLDALDSAFSSLVV